MRTVFKGQKGKEVRESDIEQASETLKPNFTSDILGLHTFTDCDITGKFYGKSRLSRWSKFT